MQNPPASLTAAAAPTTDVLARRPSGFYATVATDASRDDLLRAYLGFLAQRNGDALPDGRFALREQWMAASRDWPGRFEGTVDAARFERHWQRFDARDGLPPEVVALLAFVKVNAGEAYGVEAVARAREKTRREADDAPLARVERVLTAEENYHTRILLGAAQHFGVAPRGAFRPPLALRLTIGALVHAPGAWFHPVLLGSELAGVYTFQWLLGRVGEVFRDAPDVRDSLERRLVEILVDEVGHVAFNRLAVGPLGLSAGRAIAPFVLAASGQMNPEFRVLGWNAETERGFARFDLGDLPAEVRRRAFFA